MADDMHNNEIQIRPEKRHYTVQVVDHNFISDHWQKIEPILDDVFSNSEFSSDFDRTRPVEHTLETIRKHPVEDIAHVIVTDEDNQILGAAFCIPVRLQSGSKECDLGWFFTANLHRRFRYQVLKSMASKVHQITAEAGFESIVTEMGTEAGARIMSRRFGYQHMPTENQPNRWVKKLN